MKKETILETVDDFVNFVLTFYYIKSRYTLEIQKNNMFVDKEAGDKWEDEYYGIVLADCNNDWKEYYEKQRELIERRPEQKEIVTYYLSCPNEFYREKHLYLSEELGKLIESVWTKVPSRYDPDKLEMKGMLTLPGILKRLGKTDIKTHIKDAELKHEAQEEKQRKNNFRKSLLNYANEIKKVIENSNNLIDVNLNMTINELLEIKLEE